MSIEISVEDNFDALEGYLDDLKANAAIQAARFSLNRTLLTLRERSVQRIRERLNVKVGVLKKKHLVIDKAKGGSLATMEGLIKYNTTPIPMLEFVSGSKQPRAKKGIPVKKRKPLKARIRPGKTIKLRKAFIADANSRQVFKGGKGKGFKKQGVTSVGFIFKKQPIRTELQILGGRRFTELFTREYARRVDKAQARRQKEPMRRR